MSVIVGSDMSSTAEAEEVQQVLQELPRPEAVQVPEPGSSTAPQNGTEKQSDSGNTGSESDNKGAKINEEFQLGVAVSVYQNSGILIH